MNNQIVFFILFGILCALFGYFAYRSYTLIKAIVDHRRRKKTLPSLEVATAENVCKGGHKWDQTKLVMHPLPLDTYSVCTECGFVSNQVGDFKLNGPGLEVYKGHIVRRDARLKRWDETFKKKQEAIHFIMNSLIKNHIGLIGPDLHENIKVFEQFFRKANIELDALYSELNKLLEEDKSGG